MLGFWPKHPEVDITLGEFKAMFGVMDNIQRGNIEIGNSPVTRLGHRALARLVKWELGGVLQDPAFEEREASFTVNFRATGYQRVFVCKATKIAIEHHQQELAEIGTSSSDKAVVIEEKVNVLRGLMSVLQPEK